MAIEREIGDDVAASDAEPGEARRRAIDAVSELGVGQTFAAARDRKRIAVEAPCPVDEIDDEQRDLHFDAVMRSIFVLKTAGAMKPRTMARTMPWRSMKMLFGSVSI